MSDILDLLNQFGSEQAEDADLIKAKDEEMGSGSFFKPGFHPGVTITEFDDWPEKESGSLVMANDETWLRKGVTLSSDEAEKRVFTAWATSKYTYGEKNATMMYTKLKNLVESAFNVKFDKTVALIIFKILAAKPELLIGQKVDIEVGFKKCSHLAEIDKGVFVLKEWLPKDKRYEVHEDTFFKDFAEGKAYADKLEIDLGFPDITKISPHEGGSMPDDMRIVFQKLGVITDTEIDEEESKVEEKVEVKEKVEEKKEESKPAAKPKRKLF